jgi:hypothetical protein
MDMDNFLEFAKKFYLQNVVIGPFGEPINQPVKWVVGLAKIEILDLLDLPYFGRGQYVNNCVKKLMAITHGIYLWMEKNVSIDVELIAHITGFPSWGEDPTQFLEEKTKEKTLDEEMKNKYGTERGLHGIIIGCISDAMTTMDINTMACKILRKCCKEEVLTRVVAAP